MWEMRFYSIYKLKVSRGDFERRTTPLSLRDIFHSVNGHPFVCFADISPNRGITFQGDKNPSV